jgi:glycosyltransferase involved in cell wall biosynthesis
LCGSNREGFHLPPLEAMACRCPVVSTRVGGPLDIVKDGLNGYLVDIADDEALVRRALQILTGTESEWKAMSDAAYKTATDYTWEDATDQFEDALIRATRMRAGSQRTVMFAPDLVGVTLHAS